MSEKTQTDVAIIGAGSAGLVARRTALKAGARVIMIDPGPYGTTCARVGCMPSKLVIAAAHVGHTVANAETYGVRVQAHDVDGEAVMRRVREQRDRFASSAAEVVEEGIEAGNVLPGRAQIVREGVLEVEGHGEVHYKRLILATGSSPFVPPPFRSVMEHALTNENVFELPTLPESLLVVGLGAIGLELGQAFHRLGVRTTLIGVGGQIGPLVDPSMLEAARTTLRRELDMHPEYELKSVTAEGKGVRLAFVDSTGRIREESFERMLMAAGRRPNLHGLGLENLGITPDDKGRFPIHPGTLQLGDLPVFVAGDANNLHPLLHEAADDGNVAGGNAARFPELREVSRRTPLAIVFCEPQIAIVGQGYGALSSCEAAAGEYDFAGQARARMHGDNLGFVRIYGAHETGRLLGAELFLPRAEHMAHLLAWIIQCGVTVEQALDMPFYHPVYEEGLRNALRDLASNLRRGERIKCAVEEVGVGG